MGDRYDVVVRPSAEEGGTADPINIGQVLMVALDEFGTLTIEAVGTIQSFQRDDWEGFSVTKTRPASNA